MCITSFFQFVPGNLEILLQTGINIRCPQSSGRKNCTSCSLSVFCLDKYKVLIHKSVNMWNVRIGFQCLCPHGAHNCWDWWINKLGLNYFLLAKHNMTHCSQTQCFSSWMDLFYKIKTPVAFASEQEKSLLRQPDCVTLNESSLKQKSSWGKMRRQH